MPGLAGANAVAAGGTFACAILADRSVACFGNNELGGLARPVDEQPHPEPLVIAGVADARAISVGAYHACALLGDTTVTCWGYNASGQLGRGSSSPYESRPAPVIAP